MHAFPQHTSSLQGPPVQTQQSVPEPAYADVQPNAVPPKDELEVLLQNYVYACFRVTSYTSDLHTLKGDKVSMLTLKVLVTTIDALGHFETG